MAVLKDKSGPQSEQVKKNIQKTFKEHELDIIIQCNMKVVNYSDVTFSLNKEIKYIQKKLTTSTKCHPANCTIHRIKVIHHSFQ